MTPQVALVTGAAERIGAAIARRLASAGHSVVIHYRNSGQAAKALAAEIKASGGTAATMRADLSSRRQRAGLIANAAKPFGPLTLLVNNASTYLPDSVADLDEGLWDAHFSVHVEAPAFLARDFAAQLPEGIDGNIINVIDERVLHLSPAYFSYTLSKAALLSATTMLAQSLAPRIRVNAIGPGPTLPPAGASPAGFYAAVARLPLGHGARPDELADAILFILNSPSMTGQMLTLDGGQHLQWSGRRAPTPRS